MVLRSLVLRRQLRLRVYLCSLDAAFVFATVCNRLQPFATVRNPLQPSAIRKLREEGYGRDSHFWRFLCKRFLRQHLQRFRFWLQFFWCITWPCVTLALQNMPPKARAPEARMAFQ